MKKITLLILTATLLAAILTGCGNTEPENPEVESETAILDLGSNQTARPAGTTGGADLSAEIPEAANYSVVLNSYNENQKLELIKYLRENLGLNLADAKSLSEVLPATIYENVTKEKADSCAEELKAFGGITTILDSEGNSTSNILFEEGKTYDLVLESYPSDSKTSIIKYLRNNLGLGLADAKNFSETLPKTLFTGISGNEAQAAFEELTALGAIITATEN